MRLLSFRSAALASLALAAMAYVVGCTSDAGGSDALDDEAAVQQSDDVTSSGGSVFAVRVDTRKCASPGCGGYFVSRPNRPTTTCPDGKALPECYVAVLDLAPAKLSPEQETVVRDAISPTSAFLRVLLRGSLKKGPSVGGIPYGTVTVGEAYVAPEITTLTGTLHRVSTSANCPAKGCTALRQQDVNTSATRGLAFLDAMALADGALANHALAGAYSTGGVLVLGDTAGSTGARTMAVSHAFTRLEPGAPLCDAALDASIASASEGWLWMSESDYPVVPFTAESPSSGPLTENDVRTLLGVEASKPVDERTLAVFEGVGRNEPGMAPEEVELAVRYRRLRHVLETNLTDVRVFYVGEVELDVLIVGRTRCGTLAGVRTTAIET